MRRAFILAVTMVVSISMHEQAAASSPPPDPQAVLASRFDQDRTNACVLAAVVRDSGEVSRGRYCARANGGPGYDDLIEIGSVAKTMLGFTAAHLVRSGKWSLVDPVVRHLPALSPIDARIGSITIAQLLTHTSGLPVLPPGFVPSNAADPYADMTSQRVLQWLAKTRLDREPGAGRAYSNFGMLVLSAAVSNSSGMPAAELLRRQLFEPLGMAATVGSTAKAPRPSQGYGSHGAAVPSWHTSADLVGVGLVLSTLNDMARFVAAHLSPKRDAMLDTLHATREPVAESMGWGWSLLPAGGRTIALHEGGTAGSSSLVAIDADRKVGVVVLSDVSLADMGGLSDVALRLLGADAPLASPRRRTEPEKALVDALVGEYVLAGAPFVIRKTGGQLTAQAGNGAPFELQHDSRGHFYPVAFQANLEPATPAEGRVPGFVWRQGGAALPGTRVEARAAPNVDAAAVDQLLGVYLLAPGFELRVFREEGRLRLQATGQQAIDAQAASPSRIVAPAFGIAMEFVRDGDGRVAEVVLNQAGRALRGKRQ